MLVAAPGVTERRLRPVSVLTLRNRSNRGLLLALGGVLLISPDALITKLVADTEWTILFWRGALMALTLTIATVVMARRRTLVTFRAIGRDALERLGMREETFGWNLEMQMRAAAATLRIVEVPVGQRRRAGGVSKVSGDLTTAVRAAWVLVATFVRLATSIGRSSPRA